MTDFFYRPESTRYNLIPSILTMMLVLSIDLFTPLGFAVSTLYLIPMILIPYRSIGKLNIYIFLSLILFFVWGRFLIGFDSGFDPFRPVTHRLIVSFILLVITYIQIQRAKASKELTFSEDNLKRSEERFRLAQEHSPDGFTLFRPFTDSTGRLDFLFTFENKAAAKLIGRQPEEVTGRTLLELYPSSINTQFYAAYKKAHDTQTPVEFEDYYSGERLDIWLRMVIVPSKGEIAVISQDITERKKAEEALRESEERFRQTFEKAAAGIAYILPDGSWLKVNDRYCTMMGYNREELKHLTFKDLTHPEDLEKDMRMRKKLFDGLIDSFSTEKRYVRKDGSIKWAILTCSLAVEESTGLQYMISVLEDITELKFLQEANERNLEILEKEHQKLGILSEEQRRSQLRFEKAEALAHAGSWVMNVRAGIAEISSELARILGIDPDTKQLSIEEFNSFIHPDDKERLIETYLEPRIEGKAAALEYRIIRKDGEVRYIHGIIEVAGEENGKTDIRFGTITDITERKITEIELQKERELFEGIFNSIPVMITIYDPALKNFRFNEALHQLTGWTLEDAADGNFIEKVYPDPEYRKEVTEFMQSLTPGWKEFILTGKDNSQIESSWSNILLGSGTQIGIGIDLSEIKNAERSLRESQAKLLEAQRIAHIGSYTLHYENNTVEFSEELYRIFGWDPKTKVVNYEDVMSSIHPEDYSFIAEAIRKSIEERTSIELDYRIITPDGHVKYLHTMRAPVFDSKGNLIGAFGTSMDITQRKLQQIKLEETLLKLRKSEAILLDAQKLARLGSYTIDFKNNGKMEWSDEMYNIWEMDKNKPLPTVEETWRLVHPEDRDILHKVLTHKSLESETVETEFRIIFPGNRIKYVHIITRVIFDDDGNLWKREGIEMDITERKIAQAELEKTLKKLERSNEELKQFAYVASHDLQEPLRMVSSYMTILEKRYYNQLDDKAKEFIRFAVDGSKRMSGLIKDLLAYSRVASQANDFKEVDLNKIFKDVTRDLLVLIKEKGAHIISAKLPVLKADSTQMHQLFQNLIGNAIKFHGKNAPDINIRAKEIENGWLFSIKDNGIGIDSNYFDRIFQVFQRLHEREKYPGTGIGLAICKKIIERHGGRIWVESEPGRGSTFYFTIPDQKNMLTPEERDNMEMMSN